VVLIEFIHKNIFYILMEIKHVCSFGYLCHCSLLLKNNNLKKCSYPFDWIFINYNNIIHCIEDNFNIFLNKLYYVSVSKKQCIHKYYKILFNHHNPLKDINDYNYFIRCVNRFIELLQNKENKLFVIMFVNKDNIKENSKKNIINFNNKFSKYTSNYKLLVIFNIHKKLANNHIFTYHENIDFLELHTLSSSNGSYFDNNQDNKYLNDIINKTYKFNV